MEEKLILNDEHIEKSVREKMENNMEEVGERMDKML